MTKSIPFYARENNEKQRQLLRVHLENVAHIADDLGERMRMSATVRLIALLHDAGKADTGWQHYLHYGGQQVNHSPMSVKVLSRVIGMTGRPEAAAVVRYLAPIVWGHHSGIPDISPQHDFGHKFMAILPNPDGVDAVYKDSMSELVSLASAAIDEIVAASQHDEFWWRIRMLHSILVCADWHDAWAWECSGGKPDFRTDWPALASRVEQYANSIVPTTPLDYERARLSEATMLAGGEMTPGIYWLSSPTGMGKTLAATRAALACAVRRSKNTRHIIYCAPYNTILKQSARSQRVFGVDSELVTESYFNAGDEDEFDVTNALSTTVFWDSPIIMTSYVQLLNAMMGGRQSDSLRFSALIDSIVIMDEIQQLPFHSISLFNSCVQWLCKACGTIFIFCTATKPLLSCKSLDVPLSTPGQELVKICSSTRSALQAAGRSVHFIDDSQATRHFSSKQLGEYLIAKAKAYPLLCIVNTKTVARKVYLYVKQRLHDIPVFLLTRNMCQAHVDQSLQRIRELLAQKMPVIVVSTQLIEAGIDISFHTLIRTVTAIPSVVQAAGRINRNGEYGVGYCYIVCCAEEQLSGYLELQRKNAMETLAFCEKNRIPIESEMANDRYFRSLFSNSVKGTYSSTSFPIGDSTMLQKLQTLQFRKAFSAYQVISNDEVPVLVPYSKGKQLIDELRDADSHMAHKLAKQISPYTVNVPTKAAQQYLTAWGISYALDYSDIGLYPTKIHKLEEQQ